MDPTDMSSFPVNTTSASPLAMITRGAIVCAIARTFGTLAKCCVTKEHGIEHQLTKPNHPWTTDVIDKGFLCGSAVFSSGARVTAWRRAGREVEALPRSLYRRTSVAAPVRTFFGPRGFQPVTKRA